MENVLLGESGTGARLVTAALALCARPGKLVHVAGSGSLARRSSPALFAALGRAGVQLEHEGPAGGWPVRLTPTGPPSELLLIEPTSSQEVSALLIALAAYPGAGYLRVRGSIPSEPYVALTRAVLARFGVGVEMEPPHTPAERTYVIRGPLTAPAEPFVVEPDASAAAVALAAGCLAGGEVRVMGLGADSAQGDVRIVEHLARFGCSTRADADELSASGPPITGASLDLAGEPDLAPVLVAVAAAVALWTGEPSRMRGLGTLPGKESSRIDVLAGGLTALGLAVEKGSDRISIARGAPTNTPVVLDPAGDHRMAFAFALLGLARDGIAVRDPGCVAKSWPTFWEDLQALGARRMPRGSGA